MAKKGKPPDSNDESKAQTKAPRKRPDRAQKLQARSYLESFCVKASLPGRIAPVGANWNPYQRKICVKVLHDLANCYQCITINRKSLLYCERVFASMSS